MILCIHEFVVFNSTSPAAAADDQMMMNIHIILDPVVEDRQGQP
jgi:hypothetical protein